MTPEWATENAKLTKTEQNFFKILQKTGPITTKEACSQLEWVTGTEHYGARDLTAY